MTKKRPPQTKDPVTHRFQSVLTRELCDQLCETHEKGRDFRNVTAVRCKVHPVLLTRWLKRGQDNPDDGLFTELFMRFGAIEGDVRAGYIHEVENPISMTEETAYDSETGKPLSKTVVARRTQGIQWLMERRFRQFRADYVPKPDDLEIAAMLEPQPQSALNQEAALQIVGMIAQNPERLPEPLRQIFLTAGWSLPAKAMTDGQTTAH